MPDGRYHHGDLRAALLDSATRTLRTGGVGSLSLRELARDVGVSHAAPSRHFKDKRALLNALAMTGFERLAADLESASALEAAFDRRLAAMARAYVTFAVDNAELLELMFVGKHAPDASPELHEAGQRLGVPVFALIADGQRAGEVFPGDVERIALVVFAGLHGFASLTASGMLPADEATDGLDDIVEHLLRGLRPR